MTNIEGIIIHNDITRLRRVYRRNCPLKKILIFGYGKAIIFFLYERCDENE